MGPRFPGNRRRRFNCRQLSRCPLFLFSLPRLFLGRFKRLHVSWEGGRGAILPFALGPALPIAARGGADRAQREARHWSSYLRWRAAKRPACRAAPSSVLRSQLLSRVPITWEKGDAPLPLPPHRTPPRVRPLFLESSRSLQNWRVSQRVVSEDESRGGSALTSVLDAPCAGPFPRPPAPAGKRGSQRVIGGPGGPPQGKLLVWKLGTVL